MSRKMSSFTIYTSIKSSHHSILRNWLLWGQKKFRQVTGGKNSDTKTKQKQNTGRNWTLLSGNKVLVVTMGALVYTKWQNIYSPYIKISGGKYPHCTRRSSVPGPTYVQCVLNIHMLFENVVMCIQENFFTTDHRNLKIATLQLQVNLKYLMKW